MEAYGKIKEFLDQYLKGNNLNTPDSKKIKGEEIK
tara:strand:- start:205 stop:309 length:105 start_codon:yes stop_codon:yes gene_type:complete